jgi:sec-independent protein translocase protein TatC
MASDLEEYSRESEELEEGGGPVKSFLEHLEDLRWSLIKSLVAVLVSMLVCMVGGRYLVSVLMWPLKHPWFLGTSTNQSVVIHLGTNVLGQLPPESLNFTNGFTNIARSYSMVLKPDGTNIAVGLVPDGEPFLTTERQPPVVKNYGPLSSIMVAMKLALWGGLLVAAPFVFYFTGQFVLPALHVHEKKLLFQAVGVGTGLFFLGVAFCYFVITGVALVASVEFSQWMGFAADEWRAEEYISFVTKFMLGMGLSFQLPVVILVLVKIGLLDYQKLAGFRTYMVVINLVAAAFITPSGDPFTMLLFAAPLQILYELSVLVAWSWARKERKQAEAEAEAGRR